MVSEPSSNPADPGLPEEISGLRMTRQRQEVYRVLMHDRDHPTSPPLCLSCDTNGDPVGLSFDPDITDDGDYVVFSALLIPVWVA